MLLSSMLLLLLFCHKQHTCTRVFFIGWNGKKIESSFKYYFHSIHMHTNSKWSSFYFCAFTMYLEIFSTNINAIHALCLDIFFRFILAIQAFLYCFGAYYMSLRSLDNSSNVWFFLSFHLHECVLNCYWWTLFLMTRWCQNMKEKHLLRPKLISVYEKKK